MKKIILLIFLIFSFTSLVFTDSNGIWNYVSDLRQGIFGSDEYSGDYTFNNNIIINGSGHIFIKVNSPNNSFASYLSLFENNLKKWSVGQNPSWSSGSNNFYIYKEGSLSTDHSYIKGLTINNLNGNVGIGITNPQAKLHIQDSYASIFVDTTDHAHSSWISFFEKGIKKWSVGQNPSWSLGSNDFYIRGNSGETLVIKKSTNNVGIATTTPTQKLDVNGKIRMRSQTQSSDADDIVATKKYVDDNSGSLSQSSCYWRSLGDGVGVSAICNNWDYVAKIQSNGLTTGSKHWFGKIYCCRN